MALTKDRNTPRRLAPTDRVFDVAATTTIHGGALVALNASGEATPGAVSTTLTSVGVAEEKVDNSAGAAGDKTVKVKRGVFRFANSAGADEITAADIGQSCYIVDDETVAKTDGTATRSVAGKVYDVDTQGVWVEII